MTDMETHLGVQQLWKLFRDPKTVSNSPRNGSELAKTVSVADGQVNALLGSLIVQIALGPKTVSNSERNEPELADIESVDDHT